MNSRRKLSRASFAMITMNEDGKSAPAPLPAPQQRLAQLEKNKEQMQKWKQGLTDIIKQSATEEGGKKKKKNKKKKNKANEEEDSKLIDTNPSLDHPDISEYSTLIDSNDFSKPVDISEVIQLANPSGRQGMLFLEEPGNIRDEIIADLETDDIVRQFESKLQRANAQQPRQRLRPNVKQEWVDKMKRRLEGADQHYLR